VGGNGTARITYQVGQDSNHNGTVFFNNTGGWVQWIGNMNGAINNWVVSGDAGDGKMHFALTNYSTFCQNGMANVSNITVSCVNIGQVTAAADLNPCYGGVQIDHCYIFLSGTTVDHCFAIVTSFKPTNYDQVRLIANTVFVPRSEAGLGADHVQLDSGPYGGTGLTLCSNVVVGYGNGYTGTQHQDGLQIIGGPANYVKVCDNWFIDIANYPFYGDLAASATNILIYNNVCALTDPNLAKQSMQALVLGRDDGIDPNNPVYEVNCTIANNATVGYTNMGSQAVAFGNDPKGLSTQVGCVVANNAAIGGSYFSVSSQIQSNANVQLTEAQAASSFKYYSRFAGTNNDLHLLAGATSLIGKGTNLTSYFTTDKDGNTRPASGAWDIGPYEYSSGSIQEPVISNVRSAPATNTAVIAWTTDENANSIVNYGLTSSYGTSVTNSSSVTNHSVILSNLTAGTLYHFQVHSVDSTSRLNSSGDFTFSTTSTNLPPVVSAITQNGADVDPNAAGLQIYAGSEVQYSGSAYDPNGYPISWQWSYTVNGGSEVVLLSGTGTVASVTFNYTAGTAGNTYVWQLSVSDGYATTQTNLTVGVEAPPLPACDLTFSATSGTVTAPFVVSSNYIYQPVQTTVVSNGGCASYSFTITNAGNYVIQALVNAPNDGANSFFVNIDAEPQSPTMIWDIPLTTGFEQRIVSWRGNGTDTDNQFVPKIFSLTQGAHELIIVGREAYVQLETLYVLKVPPAWQSGLHIVSVP
jgi:hypothetical protein